MSSPEASLWMMVLNQAALDVFEIRSGCSGGARQVLARDALAWFHSRKNDPGSFIWVCGMLNLDHAILRRKVLALDRAAVQSAVQRATTIRGTTTRTTTLPLQRRYNTPLTISKISRNPKNSSKKTKQEGKKKQELEVSPCFSNASSF